MITKLTQMFALYVKALNRQDQLLPLVPATVRQMFQMMVSREMQMHVARACRDLDIDPTELRTAALASGVSTQAVASIERLVGTRQQRGIPTQAAHDLLADQYLPVLNQLAGCFQSPCAEMTVADLVANFTRLERDYRQCEALTMMARSGVDFGEPANKATIAFIVHGSDFVYDLSEGACRPFGFGIDNLSDLLEGDNPQQDLSPLVQQAGLAHTKGSPNKPEVMSAALPVYVAQLVIAVGTISAAIRTRCGVLVPPAGVHDSR